MGHDRFDMFGVSPHECGPCPHSRWRHEFSGADRRHAQNHYALPKTTGRPLSRHALLADVGGTNVRFALADTGAPAPLLSGTIQQYEIADFASLAAAAGHYLHVNEARVTTGVLAIAGRVHGDQARMTNHPWVVSRPEIQAALGLDTLALVNDFVAQSMSVRLLGARDQVPIGPSMPVGTPGSRTCAVIGPGTGLGVGALIVRQGHATALATEAGHVSFAPGTDEEIAVLRHLAERFGHVSNERLVSGTGLLNLHRALAAIAGAPCDPDLLPADITAGAEAGDEACCRTVDLFCAVFGSIAGDTALAFGAWDGVYLSGGVVSHVLRALAGSRFRARFEAKGRYAQALSEVPTLAITHPQPGLLGAAAIACDLAREHAR